MKNSHMFQDSGTVVGDDYFTIAGLNLGTSLTWASGGDLGIVELCWSYHFIHTTRTERCTNGITNSYKSVSRSCCELWVLCVWHGKARQKVDACDIYPWRPECCWDAPRWAFPCLGSLSLQEWVWQLQPFGKEMNAIEVWQADSAVFNLPTHTHAWDNLKFHDMIHSSLIKHCSISKAM